MRCFLCSKRDNQRAPSFDRITESTVPSSKKPLSVVLQHLGNCVRTKMFFRSNALICAECFGDIVEYDKLMIDLLSYQRRLSKRLQEALKAKPVVEEVEIDLVLENDDLNIETDEQIEDAFNPDLDAKEELIELDDIIEDTISNESSNEEQSEHSKWSPDRKRAIHECVACGMLFGSRAQLQSHIGERHNSKVYACNICGAVRRDEEYLELHMNLHEGKTENECRYCSKRFSRPVNTLRHMRKHWDKKKYQCEKCGERFSQDNLLYNHRLRHDAEENPLICNMCNQSFKSRKTYNHHMLIHQENRPRYSCSHCTKSFTERYTLKMHMKTHFNMDELPIQTEEGKETEAAVSVLMEDGVAKDYTCIICNSKFELKEKLEQHLQTEHDVILK